MIKQMKLNLIRAVMRPMFANRLGLKICSVARFKAFKKIDKLEFSGFGMLRNSVMFGEAKCNDLKLSENLDHEAVLYSEIKKHTSDFTEYDVALVIFDFEQGFVKTEVYYRDLKGNKKFQDFISKI